LGRGFWLRLSDGIFRLWRELRRGAKKLHESSAGGLACALLEKIGRGFPWTSNLEGSLRHGLKRLRKNSWRAPQSPSAAKAVDESKPVIAAVNRCANQNQVQERLFPQPLKPH